MKKVLALTLVLVMAFASSAMAAVTFDGKFTATGEMKSFKVFADEYTLSSGLEFNIKAAADNETEETVNWEFSGGLDLATDGTDVKAKFGKYKLTLNDQYFTATVWGNEQELSDKATAFEMIKAKKAAGATEMRARVAFDVMDYADITLDFQAPNNLRAFVEGEIAGFDLGLAYARTNWAIDTDNKVTANDVIVAQVGTTVDAGVEIDATAAAGVTLGQDLGLALGFDATVALTEEIKVQGKVTNANAHWDGDALTANNTVLFGKVSYEDAAISASASVEQTLVKNGTNANTITLAGSYRMSDTLSYTDLFAGTKWFTNTAPAFNAQVKFVDLEFDSVVVKAAAPVVADMVWVKAEGTFKAQTDYKAAIDGYIKATDKLTLKPAASYTQPGKVIDLKLVADYLIGLSDTTLSFTVQKVMADDTYAFEDGSPAKELIQAKVTIPF